MDLPGIIRLSTQEAREIKDELLAHRDNLDTHYKTRLEFGANPEGSEMLYIKEQKRKVTQSLKIINQRLQDETLISKQYRMTKEERRRLIENCKNIK